MSQRLSFSRSLYDPEAVAEAVAAFGALATFDVDVGDTTIVVTYRDPDPDVASVLADELGNHALARTIARHRAL